MYKSKKSTIDWDKFDELSDKTLSDSSEASEKNETGAGGSRFLKKKPTQADYGSAVASKKPSETELPTRLFELLSVMNK